jgi:hypothetical protein
MSGGGQAKRSDGRANLNDFAMLAGWPTPNAGPLNLTDSNWEDRRQSLKAKHINGNGFGLNLGMSASLAGWKTPCVPNGGRISGNLEDIGKHSDGSKAQIGLENEAKLTGWRTPKYEDPLTAFGDKPIGYLLGLNGWEIVPACGQLNAAHSRWLMGLPRMWDTAGIAAFLSLKKRRRASRGLEDMATE